MTDVPPTPGEPTPDEPTADGATLDAPTEAAAEAAAEPEHPAPGAHLDVAALHAALDAQRRARDLSWRQLAHEAGVSPSTLSRMQQGRRPDVDGFAALVAWLGVSADDFLRPGRPPRLGADDDLAPPAAIASYLRARAELSPRSAEALEAIVEAAYHKLKDGE